MLDFFSVTGLTTVVISLPFFGALVSLLTARLLGPRGIGALLIINMGLTVIGAGILFVQTVVYNHIIKIVYGVWLDFGWGRVDWGFWADNTTALMVLTVSVVSFAVHAYSVYYMENDPFLSRFLTYLSLFTFCMLFLLSADNLVQLFFGWEGVGLCSYLLINFWYTRPQANKAALKAIMVNRVGDCGLLFAIAILINEFGSAHLQDIFCRLSNTGSIFESFDLHVSSLQVSCWLLLLAVSSKSAQLGLHTWLPDAMEGPTPVSALIHAATMVTAGIYLLIRTAPLFEYAPNVLLTAALLGGLTAVFAALVALVQFDLKKIIAYSTCSQLGYMVMACGTTNFALALFHLVNHAFFKALLFLGAGTVIHGFAGEQDVRKMGGLRKIFPIGLVTMATASAALSGIPFFSGFYSKDAILGSSLVANSPVGGFLWLMGTVGAAVTALYSNNILNYVFSEEPLGTKKQYLDWHGVPFLAVGPLVLLGLGSVISGLLLRELVIGFGQPLYSAHLAIFTAADNLLDFVEWLPMEFKLLPLLVSFWAWVRPELIPAGFQIIFYFKNWFFFYKILANKWYFDHVYSEFVAWPVYRHSYKTIYRLFDKGAVEGLGLTQVSKVGIFLARQVSQLQNGDLGRYLFLQILGFFTVFDFCLFYSYF